MTLALQELGAGKQATTKCREECCNKPMRKVHRFRKGRSRDCLVPVLALFTAG